MQNHRVGAVTGASLGVGGAVVSPTDVHGRLDDGAYDGSPALCLSTHRGWVASPLGVMAAAAGAALASRAVSGSATG